MVTKAGKPSSRYARVFSAVAIGGYLLVTGAIGYNVSGLHGFFKGGRWVDGPVWWQIALGIGGLLLAAFWARLVTVSSWVTVRPARSPRPPSVKSVGHGATSAAAKQRKGITP